MLTRIFISLLIGFSLFVPADVTQAKRLPAINGSTQQPGALPEVESSLAVRGRTSALIVTGRSLFQVTKVEVEPPSGVKVIEIGKVETRPGGINAVSIVLSVDANAEVGQRVATLMAADGRMEIIWFYVGTHHLTIAGLKPEPGNSAAAPRANEEADYSFSFEDEAGDISADDADASVLVQIRCGRTSSGYTLMPRKITLTDRQRGSVRVSLSKGWFVGATQDCELLLRLKDRDGNESNALKTSVPFQGK
ncbi:MAG: hypothetical protein U0Z53_11215 [Blastocatellia bacterium]